MELSESSKTLMPTGRKHNHVAGRATTIYLSTSWNSYQKLVRSKLGTSGSSRLSYLMEQDLRHLQGHSETDSEAIEGQIRGLETQVSNVILKGAKLVRFLECRGVYYDIQSLTEEWGLDFEFYRNVKIVILKLLGYKPTPEDKFGKSDLELFIQALGFAVERVRIKAELDRLRLLSIDAPVPLPDSQPQLPSPTEKPSKTLSVEPLGFDGAEEDFDEE